MGLHITATSDDFPAALFMTALFTRSLQPQQYQPAHTAQRIVDWYAARNHQGLWVFLIGFPLIVFAIGAETLARSWHSDAALRQTARECAGAIRRNCAVLVVALATAASAGVLGIVVLHLIAG